MIKYVVSCRPGRVAHQPELDRRMIYGRWTDTNGPFRPADQALCPNLDPQIYGELCTRPLAQTDYCVCACICFIYNIPQRQLNRRGRDEVLFIFFLSEKKLSFWALGRAAAAGLFI